MTDRSLVEPVKVEFTGRDADTHRMDAIMLGQSLSGMGRIYNSIGHFYFHGQLRSSEHSVVRVQVGPPEPGSVFYLLYMLLVHGKMAVYPELLFEMAELAVPAFVKGIIAKKTGQTDVLEKALQVIDNQNARYHGLVVASQENEMRTRTQLIRAIDNLASQNRLALSDMAAPVGKTVDQIAQRPSRSEPIIIDAPVAEALRSPEEVIVGETEEYRGLVLALDTTTGAFKFKQEDSGREFRGKITDPALLTPQNIYSHALDTKEPITVIAKPTIHEDGEIHKLFVSDAKTE